MVFGKFKDKVVVSKGGVAYTITPNEPVHPVLQTGERGFQGTQGVTGTQGLVGSTQAIALSGATGCHLVWTGVSWGVTGATQTLPSYTTQEEAKSALSVGQIYTLSIDNLLRQRRLSNFYTTLMVVRIETVNANDTFRISMVDTLPDAVIDWGDGSSDHVTTMNANVTHTYAIAGSYNIAISGVCNQLLNPLLLTILIFSRKLLLGGIVILSLVVIVSLVVVV